MKDFSWLPPIIKLSEYSGDTILYLNVIYNKFVDSVVNSSGVFVFKRSIKVSNKLENDGKHERFWHVITDPHNPSINAIKYARAERIPWIRAILENHLRTEVLVYERIKNKKNRLHLFIPEHNYIVVIQEGRTSYYFITAFYIDYTYKLKEYEREYSKYGPKIKTAP